MAKLRVTMVKSAIGYEHDQQETLQALGLRHIRQSVIHEDNHAIRGMINKVRHLVMVEEAK